MDDRVTVTPPESLVRYNAPLFNGIENDPNQSKGVVENTAKLDEMIHAMLPAREWVEESGIWSQHVSMEPASRLDVITLQERLDAKLSERKARESGICPVREELYSQGFDELIRQVALEGPERGLLMMRTRDELRMTIDAYKTLFASSVAFGIKKQLQAERGIPDLAAQVEAARLEKEKLELEVTELRSQMDITEKRELERKVADDKRRKEELDFLKYQGQHLDSFLKQISSK
jgi:dynein light intermediate chain, axonemal|eukprot:GSChrysophyteH2.ASY1.ANO1.629.1 assembled CDS